MISGENDNDNAVSSKVCILAFGESLAKEIQCEKFPRISLLIARLN